MDDRRSGRRLYMKSNTYDSGGRGEGGGHLVRRLLHGDPRALARAISLVENDAPEAAAILSACFSASGRTAGAPAEPARWGGSLRIGITGAPGAGKSTLVDRLARHFLAADRAPGAPGESPRRGGKVGVIAVDPTSPFTGGAILGDRIRFQEHHNNNAFYARSMATRGSLGGLALATADVALLIEASGKDVLLIETVGVGQDEIDIARLADITLLVLVPGMGDDVQSLKAGVMEIADIFVVNKSDRDGADRVEQEIRALQSLAPPAPPTQPGTDPGAPLLPEVGRSGPAAWTPPVVRTIATTGRGIDALAAAIAEMDQWLRTGNRLAARRTHHWQRRLDAMLRAELMRRARHNGLTEEELRGHAAQVASGAEDPWQLVSQLAQKLFSPDNPT